MSRPTVSIVSISYNQEKYIGQAIEGFLAQETDFKFEIVIADDCSTDATAKIIRDYAKKYPDKFSPILRKKNVGVQPNLIGALQAAQGKYIALCEGDDYWTDPKKLQAEVDFLEANLDYSLVFHRVKVFFEKHEEESFLSPRAAASGAFSVHDLLQENFIPTNAVMYRNRPYDAIPENIMPLDWYLHLYNASFGKIGFIDKVMAECRRHAGGVWWDAYADPDRLWRKQGKSWLGLYLGMLGLYGDDPKSRTIIEGYIVALLNTFVRVDAKYHDTLLQDTLQKSPRSGEIFIHHLLGRIDELTEHSAKQGVIINHWVDRSNKFESDLGRLNATKAVRLQKHLKRLGGKAEQ